MIKEKLVDVSEWAQARVNSGEEPPWTFHKLKQLAELAQELAQGLESGMAYAPGLKAESDFVAKSETPAAENIVKFEKPSIPSSPSPNLPA